MLQKVWRGKSAHNPELVMKSEFIQGGLRHLDGERWSLGAILTWYYIKSSYFEQYRNIPRAPSLCADAGFRFDPDLLSNDGGGEEAP